MAEFDSEAAVPGLPRAWRWALWMRLRSREGRHDVHLLEPVAPRLTRSGQEDEQASGVAIALKTDDH